MEALPPRSTFPGSAREREVGENKYFLSKQKGKLKNIWVIFRKPHPRE
jgi:hypothetical protein